RTESGHRRSAAGRDASRRRRSSGAARRGPFCVSPMVAERRRRAARARGYGDEDACPRRLWSLSQPSHWIECAVTRIATVVVGAGPAGLLFTIVARILHERRGGKPGAWPLYLFDKRAAYERNHRLRIAPGPYREIARDLDHPGFDALLRFLEEHRFSPEVNRLEA